MRRPIVVPLLLIASAIIAHAASTSDKVTILDGKSFRSDIKEITEAGKVVFAGARDSIDLQSLRHIRRHKKAQKAPADKQIVWLLGGGKVFADSILISEGYFVIKSHALGKLRLPLRYVRGLQLPFETPNKSDIKAEFDRLMAPKNRADRVLARTDDDVKTVRCAVVSLTDKTLTVEYENEQREIRRDNVVAIVLAMTIEPPDRTGHCRVSLKDGSVIWGEMRKLKDNKMYLEAFPDQCIEMPWSNVHRIDVRSKRMVFASDLDPVAIQQRAIATYPWSYRKDQNVLDGPLILAEQKYTKGLGVHAPCRLTYSIRQNYSTFAATIGIDEGMDGKGDCIFKVLGDGKVLFERRIRGEDKPHEIRVDISGHDRVTLAVEAGQNLDIGDNANWCEARFVQ